MAFWQIFKTTLQNRKLLLIIMCIISVLLIWMYGATMQTLAAQTQAVNELMKALPPDLLKAFNISVTGNYTFTSFLASKQFGLLFPIMLVVLISIFTGSALAGEIDKGTILLHLNQPVSRLRLYFSKYLGGLVLLIIFIAASILPAIPVALMYNLEYQVQNYFFFTGFSILFGAAFYSIGFFASSILSDSGKVVLINISIFFIFYVINIFSLLVPQLADLKYISLFAYYDPNLSLVELKPDPIAIPLFLCVILIFTLAGAYCFKKRDISVR